MHPGLIDAFAAVEFARRPVVAVGAGVSKWSNEHAPVWGELLGGAIEHAKQDRLLGSAELTVPANSASVDELLECATKIERMFKDAGVFEEWLTGTFKNLTAIRKQLIDALYALDTAIITTNYDGLLTKERITNPITWTADPGRVLRSITNQRSTDIFHLHGYYDEPNTVIFGRDGYAQLPKAWRIEFVRKTIAAERGVVFIGFGAGLTDPSLSRLLKWSSDFGGSRINFRLGTTHDVTAWQKEREERKKEEEEAGREPQFLRGVVDVAYGEEHDDLPEYLQELIRQVEQKRAAAPPVPRAVRGSAGPELIGTVTFERSVAAVAISNDGSLLAVAGGGDGSGSRLGVWSMTNGQPDRIELDPLWVGVDCFAVAFSPDATYLAVSSAKGTQVYAVQDWRPVGSRAGFVQTLLFRDNETLLVGNCLHKVRSIGDEWMRLASRTVISDVKDPGIDFSQTRSSSVTGAVFGYDGRDVVTVSDPLDHLQLWMLPDAPEGRPEEVWTDFDVKAVAWSADGTRLVTIRRGWVNIINTEDLKRATAQERKEYAEPWRRPLGRPLPDFFERWHHFEHDADLAAVTAGGARLILAGKKSATILDVSSRGADAQIARWRLSEDVTSMALSRDGLLATAGGTQVQLWRLGAASRLARG